MPILYFMKKKKLKKLVKALEMENQVLRSRDPLAGLPAGYYYIDPLERIIRSVDGFVEPKNEIPFSYLRTGLTLDN